MVVRLKLRGVCGIHLLYGTMTVYVTSNSMASAIFGRGTVIAFPSHGIPALYIYVPERFSVSLHNSLPYDQHNLHKSNS